MAPQHLRLGRALHARGGDVFLAELLDHEAAGHAADIGEREIAEQQGGQRDVRDRAHERAPVAGAQGVDEH
jgi:hypothetical protein